MAANYTKRNERSAEIAGAMQEHERPADAGLAIADTARFPRRELRDALVDHVAVF